jgi:hypothetical protein
MSTRDRLWSRYWSIRDEHRNGYGLPILWHLALRGDPLAMTELGSTFDSAGRIADSFSQEGLAYRAYRRGSAMGAQHLAMNAFNRGDLGRYRLWLARAAGSGDRDAARELRKFELRLPHTRAARIGRKRPSRASDYD